MHKIFHNWKFYHILFWFSLVINFFVANSSLIECDLKGYFIENTVSVISYAALVYVNILLILPLYKKSFWLYLFLTLLSIGLFTYFYGIKHFYNCESMPFQRDETWLGYSLRAINAFRYVIIASLLKFAKDMFDKERELQRVSLEKIKAELDYLRSQINPHFLFNTLNNLYSLARKKSDKTPDMILKLSDMMDYMLYETKDIMVPLEKDIANLKNYIELERIRQGNNATIIFEADGNYEGKKIVPLLLLPLIENAFKHGVNNQIQDAFLKAYLTVENNIVFFAAENNIITENTNHNDKRKGTGLNNLRKRLDMFYHNNYKLETELANDIYKVYLRINLKDE